MSKKSDGDGCTELQPSPPAFFMPPTDSEAADDLF